jgi:DNA polymerase-3 subunit gamma/tau
VVKIEGAATRLVAASQAEQERLLATAAQFSEEDLTRFLKLCLDLFKDLQSSLQPRLHLEMGLLRLVHAGRLQAVEEALASLDSGNGGERPVSRPVSRRPDIVKPAPQGGAAAEPASDLRARLRNTLLEAKRANLADAIEHSVVSESANEVVFTVPKMYQIYLKGLEFEAAVKQAAGRAVKITVKVGEVAPQPAPAGPSPAGPAEQDEIVARALAHPEVQKFQELFPGSQVRKVRDLRENEA